MRNIGSRTKWVALGVGLVTVAASTVAFGAASGGNGSVLVPIAPERVIDTRQPGAQFGRMGSGQTRTLDLTSFVPADADAVELNVTVVGGTSNSHLRIWPTGETRPETSAINWAAGATVGNGLSMKLGTGQSIQIFNKAGQVDVIVDLMGYFVDEAAGTPGPPGPKGDPGVSGIQVVSASKSFVADVADSLSASCPAGKSALSGGFDVSNNIGAFNGDGLTIGPSTSGPSGWQFAGTSALETQLVTVFAVCAVVAP